MQLSDLIDVAVAGSSGGFEMSRIPGIIPGLRCPICGGNIQWEYDIDLGWERKCLPSGHAYGEQKPTLPLTHQVGRKEVNDGS